MKLRVFALSLLLALWGPCGLWAGKVLFVESYHAEYEWSRILVETIESELRAAGHEVKTVHMDTKRNGAESFKQEAGLKAKAVLEAYQPDLLIAGDDNAQKYLVVPYVMGSSLPVVFCGVNWSCDQYGYPTERVTGILEVDVIDELIVRLESIAKGNRVGFLSSDTLSERQSFENFTKLFGVEFAQSKFVLTVEDWKAAYLDMQSSVDVLLVMNNAGIAGWDDAAIEAFVVENGKIPSGSTSVWMGRYVTLAYAKKAEEQGTWAAQAALEILGGKSPGSIPIARNEQGSLILNAKLAYTIGVDLPMDIIEVADQIIE